MVALENKSSVYLSFRLAGIIFFKTTNKCLICDIIDSHNRKMCTSQERQEKPQMQDLLNQMYANGQIKNNQAIKYDVSEIGRSAQG